LGAGAVGSLRTVVVLMLLFKFSNLTAGKPQLRNTSKQRYLSDLQNKVKVHAARKPS
jgi:hypothetical protein